MHTGQGWTRATAAVLAAIAAATPRSPALAGTTGEIVGRIVDRATHDSVAGATVTALSTTGSYTATTDRNGFFSIVGAFPNTYLLAVSGPDFGTLETLAGAVNPDQTTVVDVEVDKVDSTLADGPVANVLSIVRPSVVPDRVMLTASAADATDGSGGSYGLYETPSVLGTLPGITLDEGVNAHIRGSRLDEVGFEYDGVGAVDPITGLAATNLLQDGIVRLQADEDGDQTSAASGIAAVDSIVDAGTYPPHGSLTTLVQTPTFYNGTNFEYGAATPDRRFSYFVSGIDWDSSYDWGTRGAFVAGAQSAETSLDDGPVGSAAPARDQVVNLEVRPGGSSSDDLQFLAASGFERFVNLLAPRYYPSTDPLYAPSTGPEPTGGVCDGNGFALFPGQADCTAAVAGATDHVDQSFALEKVEYSHAFGSGASFAAHVAEVDSTLIESLPFGDAPFGDVWEDRHSLQREAGAEYDVQTGQTNFLRAGAGVDASANDLLEELISSEYGVASVEPTRDSYAFAEDEVRPTARLTIDASGRAAARTYGRIAAAPFTASGTEGSAGAAYALDERTVVRGSYDDQLELPFAAMAERIVTRAPDFSDVATPNRIAALDLSPAAPRSHGYDVSFERALPGGRAVKITPFWRDASDLFVAVGSQLGTPQSIGRYDEHGIDAQLQFLHPGDGISGYVDYTHTRALASTVGDFFTPVGLGAAAARALFPVAYIAPDVANAVITWRHGRWSVNPEVAYTTGYPYGAGRLTYNDLNCPGAGPSNVGVPSAPCGALVRNPAAYADTAGGDCGPGACSHLIDPAESAFADGRVCCAALTANLNVFYDVASRTAVGVQWQNVTHDASPLALVKNPYIPSSPYGAPGFNGFVDYGPMPYIPAALDNSEEFIFTITQRL